MTESKITGRSGTKSAIVVVLLIVLLFGLGIFCIWRMSGANWSFGNNSKSRKTTAKIEDKNLYGTWQSACLVANAQNNTWEKYQFEIKNDSTAVYNKTVSSNKDCTDGTPEKFDYKYSLLQNNQINIRDTANKKTIYDIYNIKDKKLTFGHGYRGSYEESTKKGDTSANRYNSLNEYIVYEKK